MQKPCQDSYYTLFSSYPMLLDTSKNPLSFFSEYGIKLPQQGQNVKS